MSRASATAPRGREGVRKTQFESLESALRGIGADARGTPMMRFIAWTKRQRSTPSTGTSRRLAALRLTMDGLYENQLFRRIFLVGRRL